MASVSGARGAPAQPAFANVVKGEWLRMHRALLAQQRRGALGDYDLELEHCIGLSGNVGGAVQLLPNGNEYVAASGSVLGAPCSRLRAFVD